MIVVYLCQQCTMKKSNSGSNDSSSHDTDDERLLTGNNQLTSFNNWLCPESLHKIQVQLFIDQCLFLHAVATLFCC